MTITEFFEAINKGQRHFKSLDFGFEDGDHFSNKDFSGIVFEECFLYIDCRNSNFTGGGFIGCNMKEIDLRGADLTNASMTRCLLESAMFKGATVTNFKFTENYAFGSTLDQAFFNETLIHSDEYRPKGK